MAKRFLSMVEPTELQRRHFLFGCAAVAGAAACSGATTGFETDGGGGDDSSSGDDASTGDDSGDDSSTMGDAAQSTCPSTAKDTGKMPSAFTEGKPVYVGSIVGFVVRDANGLYALTAVCTHSGCTISTQGSGFYCPCHGAAFDINGAVTVGPARTALRHYAVCVSANGTIAVDTKTIVSASMRYPL